MHFILLFSFYQIIKTAVCSKKQIEIIPFYRNSDAFNNQIYPKNISLTPQGFRAKIIRKYKADAVIFQFSHMRFLCVPLAALYYFRQLF